MPVTDSLKDRKETLVSDLQVIEDPYERLAYVIDMGKNHPPMDEAYRIETFRVEGCTSNLWLYPETREGRCYFNVDSDSAVTKGVAALLSELYSGSHPEEIIELDDSFLQEIGVPQLLSPNRRNGVTNLNGKIRDYARHQVETSGSISSTG